jgi:hypothetical protein
VKLKLAHLAPCPFENDVVFRITFDAQGTANLIILTMTFLMPGIRHRAQGMNVLVNREYAQK